MLREDEESFSLNQLWVVQGRLPYIRKAIVSFPGFPGHYALLISCCGHLGFRDEAKMLLAHRNSLAGPPLTVSLNRQQMHKFAHGPVFAEGLIKAGVPES
jgi:adenylate cyclase